MPNAAFATLKLERNGFIDVVATGDASRKCGPPGANRLSYRVFVECPDDSLDQDGFLIDHNDLGKYFDEVWSKLIDFPSCERIAAKACRDIHDLMIERGSRPCGIEVTVAAFGQAGITATWPARVTVGSIERLLPQEM